MKQGQKLWTREELILAFNLYCRLPFGKLHRNNPDVIKLANIIDRSENSVAYKLVNLASLDPSLQKRGIKGAANASKLDKQIWEEFFNNWEDLFFQSQILRAKFENTSLEEVAEINDLDFPLEGKTREQIIKSRINQSFFRSTVFASYNRTCCITGLNNSSLLVAGHIRPWAIDEKNRMNPRNGIAINALHDRAFETGLLTITPDYIIKISSIIKRNRTSADKEYFLKYENAKIFLPSRFFPDPEFLRYHNNERFKE